MKKKELEEEIIEEEFEDEEYDFEESKGIKRAKLIINIVFTVIVVLILMVAIDVICVSRYEVGPFFAIPTKTYKDGGTKEYYGLGYKVIKYHQLQGRRDKEIGSWKLKYDVEPVTIKTVDLAIEFHDNEAKSYEKYYKQFVRIVGNLQKVDTKNKKIVIDYLDEGGKYSLEVNCDLVPEQKGIKSFETGKEITVIGTVNDFKSKTKTKPNRLYVINCFAEQ